MTKPKLFKSELEAKIKGLLCFYMFLVFNMAGLAHWNYIEPKTFFITLMVVVFGSLFFTVCAFALGGSLHVASRYGVVNFISRPVSTWVHYAELTGTCHSKILYVLTNLFRVICSKSILYLLNLIRIFFLPSYSRFITLLLIIKVVIAARLLSLSRVVRNVSIADFFMAFFTSPTIPAFRSFILNKIFYRVGVFTDCACFFHAQIYEK